MKNILIMTTLFFLSFITVFSQEENSATDENQNASEIQTTQDGKTIINNYNNYNTYNYYSTPPQSNDNIVDVDKKNIESTTQTPVIFKKDSLAIGYNFMPGMLSRGLSKAADKFHNKFIEKNSSYCKIKNTSRDYGVGFSLDIMLTKKIALSSDIGYAKIDTVIGKYYLNVVSMPWAVGLKIFPSGRGLSGFFFFPKVGGNVISFNGLYNNTPMTYEGQEIIKSRGMYASVELGWRIKLFPKSSANWPVRIAIDISIIDVGYYFTPWADKFINIARKYEPLVFASDKIDKYKNIHLNVFPKIGFSLIF